MSDKSSENGKITLRYVPLSELQLWDRNAKRHDIGALVASIERHGFQDPPKYSAALNDGAGGIVEGNGRGEALAMMKGQGDGPPLGVVAQDDDWLVPVLFGNDFASQRRAEAYAMDHNNLVLSGGDFTAFDMANLWDEDEYKALLTDLAQADELPVSVSGDDLDALLAGLGVDEPGKETPPAVDRAAELQAQYGTELGQIWTLGEHRLAVGDCTDKGVVEAVLQGETPLLMVTDPPYGVSYNPEWRAQNAHHVGRLRGNTLKSYGQVSGDDNCDWGNAYHLFKGDVVYVWYAAQHVIQVAINLEAAGFVIRSQIIWRKPNFVISRGDYHYQHEPCWYAVRKGKSGNWQGDRTQSTVWDIASLQPMGRSQDPLDERTGHGTQKPVECMARPIRNNSAVGDSIYDPFLGSGTTMIACEN
ncbi:hypothetical protein LCGC14_1948540, partial [marine sediment metagenome]